MYRFPMPCFISQKKQRYFLFKLFLSSHRAHISRGIEERSLSSHVISINLPIKNHSFSNAFIVLDLTGARAGASSEAQSTSNVASPLIHTLDTSRPDKYRKREKESNEVSDKQHNIIT
jgi:hypothetical protein